jgi:hypothetical protein
MVLKLAIMVLIRSCKGKKALCCTRLIHILHINLNIIMEV